MNQTQFGKLIDVSAMTVSRWERNGNMPDARSLLSLGRIAAGVGANAWEFWELAGLDKTYLRSVLE